MLRSPRGGKALSRAASGRVPGPSTTDSSLNGIMLLIIFVTVLMVASFEHSLLREQRLADGRVVEIPAPAAKLAATEPKAPEAPAKFAASAAKPAPPAKPLATAEEAAAWAARIPKQVRPPPPVQLSSQEGVDTQPAKPVAAQP